MCSFLQVFLRRCETQAAQEEDYSRREPQSFSLLLHHPHAASYSNYLVMDSSVDRNFRTKVGMRVARLDRVDLNAQQQSQSLKFVDYF